MTDGAPAPVPRCAVHPDTDAIGACMRCGSFFCPACRGWEEGHQRFCSRCDPGGEYVAWEDRARVGTVPAFFRTLKPLLLTPDRFFKRMPLAGGYGRPLLFAWISWILATGVTAVAYGLIVGAMLLIMPTPASSDPQAFPIIAGVFIATVAVILVAIVPFLFLWTLALHVVVKIFGGTGSLQATFRCHAYSSGVFALGVVPFVGLSAAQIVFVILQIFAVKNAHRLSIARSIAVVFLLPVLCCGLYFASIIGVSVLAASVD